MDIRVLKQEGYVLLDDLIGKGFAYGGRGPHQYDCYGLAIEVFRRMGKHLPEDYMSVCEPAKIATTIEEGKKHLRKISEPVKGCLVMFKIVPPYVSHLGVVLENNRFIHVFQKRMVCIEQLDGIYWRNKIAGYYDLI